MKIGIDISQVVYPGTGVASYTQNLIKELLKPKLTQEIVLFGSSLRRLNYLHHFVKDLAREKNFSAKIFHLPPSILDLLWNRLHRINIENFIGPVDLFHTSDWTEPPAKTVKVTTIHDLVVFRFPKHLPKQIIETQKKKLAWVNREAKLIFADSESTKKDIIHYLSIDAARIKVIYLGVDNQFRPKAKAEIDQVRKKYQLSSRYILFVGTQEPRKNLPRVIRAYEKLAKEIEQELVIVGNLGWGDKIKAPERVKLIGFVPQVDLPAIYSGADLFVYPSLYEGFGLPIIEALACGCPVLTSDRGSLDEVGGSVVVKINPEDETDIKKGIEQMINYSQKQRQVIINQGIIHAQKFSWEKCAQETLKGYEAAVS